MGLSHCGHHQSQPTVDFWSLNVFNEALLPQSKEETIAFVTSLEMFSGIVYSSAPPPPPPGVGCVGDHILQDFDNLHVTRLQNLQELHVNPITKNWKGRGPQTDPFESYF